MSEKNYNSQRKRILEKLDQGKNVSNMELGMYDLTPYFKIDNFDMNLYESIMVNKNYSRRIEHVKEELYFSPPQYRALACLYEKNRVIISAPTSFGKTLLVKEYIHQRKPRNIIYIVPTNALAYELEKSFKENDNFSQYVIFDKCSSLDSYGEAKDENLFFIGTQEKFLEIDISLMGEIDLFVIDEAYKLQESVISNQRAYKLSETFLDSLANHSKKIFLLTPRAKLIGFEKYKFHVFESDFNAVEKNFTILDESDFFTTLLNKGSEDKTILFCRKPAEINDTYEKIRLNINPQNDNEFIKRLEEDIHPDWSVVKLLRANILTHHGQMPKYVQNRMINLFNESPDYKILFGTNSISEGINTSTKNLFIHPKATSLKDVLLLKNTIGRAGRLGKYPIGHIFSVSEMADVVESEITISLAISSEEELAEIEDSKDRERIIEAAEKYNIDSDFFEELIKKHKVSLNRLTKILDSLRKDRKYSGITTLPYISSDAFGREYNTVPKYDTFLIKGYLQSYYVTTNNERVFLNDFNERINFFKIKSKFDWDNTTIINAYMQFIYSTLEYNIMPIVDIGIELKEHIPEWPFGTHVIPSLEECKRKYYTKTYGSLNIDDLPDSYKLVIGALKDYGMNNIIKNLNENILEEIVSQLKTRYSTTDVIRVINYLATHSTNNKSFYKDIKRKYFI